MELFTPGPLNTSAKVKISMMSDLGSRTKYLVDLTKSIRKDLEDIAKCGDDYTSVLLQGSGTFAVESMITSLITDKANVLIVSNGVYGERIIQICMIHHIPHVVLRQNEQTPINISEIEHYLKRNIFTHIITVQFETALGVLNDMNALINLASLYNCQVLIDAMSAFAVMPINYRKDTLLAVAASSNKCLHGAPGISFVIAQKNMLQKPSIAKTLSLDLVSQWINFEKKGEWRFTPPTHLLLALAQAIQEYKQQGGARARLEKYTLLNQKLIEGLESLDIYPIISESFRAPMITTFELRNKSDITFEEIYQKLLCEGLVIYPSSMLKTHPYTTFRIGCMGEINDKSIQHLIDNLKMILNPHLIEHEHEKI